MRTADWRRKDFSQAGEGAIADFSRGSQKDFSRRRPKLVKFHFSLSKLRKQPIFAKKCNRKRSNLKIHGIISPCPPLPTTIARIYFKLTKIICSATAQRLFRAGHGWCECRKRETGKHAFNCVGKEKRLFKNNFFTFGLSVVPVSYMFLFSKGTCRYKFYRRKSCIHINCNNTQT